MPSRAVDPPAEVLEELYVRQNLTIRQVAVRTGLSPRQVWRRLEEAGIPRRPSGPRRTALDPQRLEDLYLRRGLSMDAVARELRVSRGVVERSLRIHGIRRHRRERIPRPVLEELYVQRRLSAEEVAARTGTTKAIVLADLRHWGLARRAGGGPRPLSRDVLEQVYRDVVDLLGE
ncbi:MAG: winged helix-turn-helix domain-containing protein [Actinomycetota bacterium]|nr:winged helix-turn-helix domain-containing protein [Actinomycetota bacterium]